MTGVPLSDGGGIFADLPPQAARNPLANKTRPAANTPKRFIYTDCRALSRECEPRSLWRKASRLHPLIPRESKRWRSLYRGRAAVEREFGRLKNEYGLAPLRVRGLARVQLHADLTMLARLSQALARARAVPLAA